MNTQELIRKAEMRQGWKVSSFNVIEGLYGEEGAGLVSKYFREQIPQAGNGMPSSYYNKLGYIPNEMKSKPEPAELARLYDLTGQLAGKDKHLEESIYDEMSGNHLAQKGETPNIKYVPLKEEKKDIFLKLQDCIDKIEIVDMCMINDEVYDFPEVKAARQAWSDMKDAISKDPDMPSLGEIYGSQDLMEYMAKNTGGIFQNEDTGLYYNNYEILDKVRNQLRSDIHQSICRMEDIGTNLYKMIQEKLGVREAHLGYIEGHANKYNDGSSMYRDFVESIESPIYRQIAKKLVDMKFGEEDPYHEIARQYGALSPSDEKDFIKKANELRGLFTSIETYDRHAVSEKIQNMEWRDDHGKSIERLSSAIMEMNAKSLSLGERARYSMGTLQKDIHPEQMQIIERSSGIKDVAERFAAIQHPLYDANVKESMKAYVNQFREKTEDIPSIEKILNPDFDQADKLPDHLGKLHGIFQAKSEEVLYLNSALVDPTERDIAKKEALQALENFQEELCKELKIDKEQVNKKNEDSQQITKDSPFVSEAVEYIITRTTSRQTAFSLAQANAIEKVLSLADNTEERTSIAERLLEMAKEELPPALRNGAWFRETSQEMEKIAIKGLNPEDMTESQQRGMHM